MIKSQETTDPNSCLGKAHDDEPIFVLRAKDKLAPEIVERWAERADGLHEPERRTEAMQLAEQMRKWRQDNLPL